MCGARVCLLVLPTECRCCRIAAVLQAEVFVPRLCAGRVVTLPSRRFCRGARGGVKMLMGKSLDLL